MTRAEWSRKWRAENPLLDAINKKKSSSTEMLKTASNEERIALLESRLESANRDYSIVRAIADSYTPNKKQYNQHQRNVNPLRSHLQNVINGCNAALKKNELSPNGVKKYTERMKNAKADLSIIKTMEDKYM